MTHRVLTVSSLVMLSALISGCATSSLPPLKTVDTVDMPRFMGDWYVIAFIPVFIEKDATNAIEHYDLREDGDVDITYTFYKDSPDGKRKEMHARGFVPEDGRQSEWKVQFIWPFKADFLVIDLADDYSHTVIGVPDRKYLWIMSREPEIDPDIYANILQQLDSQHYDTSQIQLVPQQWDDEATQPEDMDQ